MLKKNILYCGEYSVVKKIMEKNQSFNSYYISLSEKGDVSAELNKLPFKESSNRLRHSNSFFRYSI